MAMGLNMGKMVRGHSGMENTDVPSIAKVTAFTASTLKMEKALLPLNVPLPLFFQLMLTELSYQWCF